MGRGALVQSKGGGGGAFVLHRGGLWSGGAFALPRKTRGGLCQGGAYVLHSGV